MFLYSNVHTPDDDIPIFILASKLSSCSCVKFLFTQDIHLLGYAVISTISYCPAVWRWFASWWQTWMFQPNSERLSFFITHTSISLCYRLAAVQHVGALQGVCLIKVLYSGGSWLCLTFHCGDCSIIILMSLYSLQIAGHGKCVEFMKKFNLPLLLLGGGGYTIRNVARCWAYETSIALDVEISNGELLNLLIMRFLFLFLRFSTPKQCK